MHWRRKWQPTPVFLPGEPQGQGAWWAAVYGVAQSQTRLKRLSSSSSSRELCVLIPLVYPARGYVSHTLSLPGEEQPEGKEVQTLGTHRDGVLT